MAKKTNTTINNKKYFRVSATVGFNSEGKRVRKTFYGESEKDAMRKRDEYMKGIARGLSVDYDKVTFLGLFDEWFEHVKKPSIKETSYKRYDIDYRLRIRPSAIANMRLVDINTIHIQKLYNSIGNYYKCKSVDKLLRSFFVYSLENEYIIKNPMRTVTLPKAEEVKEEVKILSKDDIEKVRAIDDKHIMFRFALFTGLRQGEILALKKSDIDMENKEVHVSKTISQQGKITIPKTKDSVRTIPIVDELIDPLKRHIMREKEKHLSFGLRFNNDSYFFSSDACTARTARNTLKAWARYCNRETVAQCDFKALRATFCTMLAEQGVPLKDASVLMGHSNINTTAKFYTFVREEQKRKSVNVLNKAK